MSWRMVRGLSGCTIVARSATHLEWGENRKICQRLARNDGETSNCMYTVCLGAQLYSVLIIS